MSTLYNRRRGAKSYRPRAKRKCAFVETIEGEQYGCIMLALVNRYCAEHQTVKR